MKLGCAHSVCRAASVTFRDSRSVTCGVSAMRVYYLPVSGGATASQAARCTFQPPGCSTTCRSKR